MHSIGNGARAILTHGAQPALAQFSAESCAEEILRWDPPLHLFTRHVYEPVEIAGHRFARGDRIGCLLAAANRDPAAFDEPARFDLSRPRRPNASFGAGLHFCVGAPLARLELSIALPTLFARCPDLRLVEASRYADLYHFHGLENLIVAR